MVNKTYCMSSYLAFRYIEREDMDFYDGIHHENIKPLDISKRIPVKTAQELRAGIENNLEKLRDKKIGILLSGGMDSAICASFLPGADAYTFRFMKGEFQNEELARAEYYAKYYKLKLHYVDIGWDTVINNLEQVMRRKAAPVHSIEPQIRQAAIQAKDDGVDVMVVGESSDLIFGGMDGLLSQDWLFDEFVNRYIFTSPASVLKEYEDMGYLFERYRNGKYIDFLAFMDDVFSIESSSSYMNAFATVDMPYLDPYANLIMADPLDLNRVRNGEPKYLVRELMASRYPEIPVPDKVPMPRPVDLYFADWGGPHRKEFITGLDMKQFTGNQKWQIYCLERFLDMYEPD